MDQQATSRKREIIATLAVLLVIVAIVGTVVATSKKDVASSATTAPTATADQTTANTQSTAANTADTASASYKDGQYTATGGYQSPGGSEEITIKVTLKNGLITDTSAQNGATDSEAKEYQSKFINNYKSAVVGKSIANVSLSRVSGSSLTPIGFNNAISQIKSQAKV